MKAKHEVLGSALHIPLPRDLKSGTSIAVKVNYHTTKDCIALQWLEKEFVCSIFASQSNFFNNQTKGRLKERPFRTFSANVNPFTLGRLRRYKASPRPY